MSATLVVFEGQGNQINHFRDHDIDFEACVHLHFQGHGRKSSQQEGLCGTLGVSRCNNRFLEFTFTTYNHVLQMCRITKHLSSYDFETGLMSSEQQFILATWLSFGRFETAEACLSTSTIDPFHWLIAVFLVLLDISVCASNVLGGHLWGPAVS